MKIPVLRCAKCEHPLQFIVGTSDRFNLWTQSGLPENWREMNPQEYCCMPNGCYTAHVILSDGSFWYYRRSRWFKCKLVSETVKRKGKLVGEALAQLPIKRLK